MSQARDLVMGAVKEPWLYSVLLLCVTPLFPDYCCFILVFAAFACALADAHRYGRKMQIGKVGVMMLIYLGYMLLSLLYSDDKRSSFWTFMMWGCMLLGYFSLITVLTHRERLRGAILCMTSVTGIVGGVGVAQYFARSVLGLDVSDKLWSGLDRAIYGVLGMPLSEISFGDRVSGTFNNPNLFAAYLTLTIPFSIAFVMTGTRSKPKAGARIALVLALYAVGFSFCRGGYLVLLALGGVLLLLYVRRHFMMTVLTLLYIAILIPSSIGSRLVSALPKNIQQSADSVQMEMQEIPRPPESEGLTAQEKLEQLSQQVTGGYRHDDSVSQRFVMWNTLLKEGCKRPLFGAGAGVGSTAKMLKAHDLDFKHAHNLFLEIFYEGGILSLLLLFGVLWLLCQRGARLLRRRSNREAFLLGFAIFGSCIALCILGVFDFPLLTPRLITTAMTLMAIAESAARIYLNGKEIVNERPCRQRNEEI